ncbi:heptaprenyl diphosphate synthase component 1 [Alteribacter aurantiacus]|uniref:heptaprenyl diphosphate synthase component 1 n=1 Tax=Alteribacter aurantiacus TaxID=254410 RepID=UPI000421E16F|nr:heptaprenyl diphosphate synthase component 1 [Alteribacter aurantiacus]
MTTSIDHLHEDIVKIKADFYEVIHHPYFRRFLTEPVIDNDQVVLLYYLLKRKGLESKYIKNTVLSNVLVQTALSVHDTVGNNEWHTELEKKQRQLTVLSGDYFSSLYYYFLAKLKDRDLIRVFTRSIQEINEIKMSAYCNENKEKSANRSSKTLFRHIDSLLVLNIAKHMKEEAWVQPLDEFFYLKKLTMDYDSYLQSNKSTPFLASLMDESNEKSAGIEYVVQKEIESTYLKLISFTYDWLPFKQYIQNRIKQLMGDYPIQEDFVAEEG